MSYRFSTVFTFLVLSVLSIGAIAAPSDDWQVTTSQAEKNLYKWRKLYEAVDTQEEIEKAFLDAVKVDDAGLAKYFFNLAEKKKVVLNFDFLTDDVRSQLLNAKSCRVFGAILDRENSGKTTIQIGQGDKQGRNWLHAAVAARSSCLGRILKSKQVTPEVLNAESLSKEKPIDIAVAQRDFTAATALKAKGATLPDTSSEQFQRMVFLHDNVMAFKLFFPTFVSARSARFRLRGSPDEIGALEAATAFDAESIVEHLLSIGFLPFNAASANQLKPGFVLSEGDAFLNSFNSARVFEAYVRWNPVLLQTFLPGTVNPIWKKVVETRQPGVAQILFQYYPDKKDLCKTVIAPILAALDPPDYMERLWRYALPANLSEKDAFAAEALKAWENVCGVSSPEKVSVGNALKIYDDVQFNGTKAALKKYPNKLSNDLFVDIAVERRDLALLKFFLDQGAVAKGDLGRAASRAVSIGDLDILKELANHRFLTWVKFEEFFRLNQFALDDKIEVLDFIEKEIPALNQKVAEAKENALEVLLLKGGTLEQCIRTLPRQFTSAQIGRLAILVNDKKREDIVQYLFDVKSTQVREVAQKLVELRSLLKARFNIPRDQIYQIFADYLKNVDLWIYSDEDYSALAKLESTLNLELGFETTLIFFKAAADQQFALLRSMPNCEADPRLDAGKMKKWENELSNLYMDYAILLESAKDGKKTSGTGEHPGDCLNAHGLQSIAGEYFCFYSMSQTPLEDLLAAKSLLLIPTWKQRGDKYRVAVEVKAGSKHIAWNELNQFDAPREKASLYSKVYTQLMPGLKAPELQKKFCRK